MKLFLKVRLMACCQTNDGCKLQKQQHFGMVNEKSLVGSEVGARDYFSVFVFCSFIATDNIPKSTGMLIPTNFDSIHK